ncbi:MAG: S8 family serine peptidase [Thermoleophilia bacterium]
MSRRRHALRLLAAGAVCAAAGVPAAAGSATPTQVTLHAAPGHARAVATELGRSALRIQRRYGRALQVSVPATRVAALRHLPGVVATQVGTTAFADEGPVVSQGVFRSGAVTLQPAADGGNGLTIAILDLGFGTGLDARRAAGELPPADHTLTRSFDTVNGLAGRNAYGNATNHGELVAQTVFDYAPKANYVFVNYRTPGDFLAAVDWLTAQHPDIVVHSNNFLEGPFDGTGVEAQAVNRAAAAGILWFNSAGNYARHHWAGTWRDDDGDGTLDWDGADHGTFYMAAHQPITFSVAWTQPPGGPPTDLDIAIQRRNDDGTWADLVTSTNQQMGGAPPYESIVGFLSPSDGYYRLAVRRAGGAMPGGIISVFTREVDLPLVLGAGQDGSVPTPADATGSISVGAVDWRGDTLKSYSSHGPTADGRIKPDLVAPTDTALAGPAGPRGVGGTSNAAPNAAGAAALLLGAERAQGGTPTVDSIRAELAADALDLGTPGPDNLFGAGRVRVDLVGPVVDRVTPAPGAWVSGVIPVTAHATDPSRVVKMALWVGDRQLVHSGNVDTISGKIDTRRYPDGSLTLTAESTDWPGNLTRRDWPVLVDNHPPGVQVLGAVIVPRRPKAPATAPRPAFALLRLSDSASATLTVTVSVPRTGRTKTLRLRPSRLVRVPLGHLPPGRVVVRVKAVDRAGNVRTVQGTRPLRVRPLAN